MRAPAERTKIETALRVLGRRVTDDHTIYLAGGTSAVLVGWRDSTLDMDVRPEPDSDALLRELAALKDQLDINIELASPLDFLPELTGWRDQSPFIEAHGRIQVRHMDFRLQALAKLERASTRDLDDVREMIERDLVDRDELARAAEEMAPRLFRFPGVDAPSFLGRVRAFLGD